MSLKPINNHVLIEPLVHDDFIASQKETYEEVGIVVAFADDIPGVSYGSSTVQSGPLALGVKVYFDSWTAAKYPRTDGVDGHFFLVKYEDIRAIETTDDKQPLP